MRNRFFVGVNIHLSVMLIPEENVFEKRSTDRRILVIPLVVVTVNTCTFCWEHSWFRLRALMWNWGFPALEDMSEQANCANRVVPLVLPALTNTRALLRKWLEKQGLWGLTAWVSNLHPSCDGQVTSDNVLKLHLPQESYLENGDKLECNS